MGILFSTQPKSKKNPTTVDYSSHIDKIIYTYYNPVDTKPEIVDNKPYIVDETVEDEGDADTITCVIDDIVESKEEIIDNIVESNEEIIDDIVESKDEIIETITDMIDNIVDTNEEPTQEPTTKKKRAKKRKSKL